jgi:hypothetical protein
MKNFAELLQRRIWVGPLIALVIFVVGLALGLVAGWETVGFKASSDDVLAAADSYAINNNVDLATARLSSLSREEKIAIFASLITRANAGNRPLEAQNLANLAKALNITASPSTSTTPAPGTTPPPVAPTPSAPTGTTGSLTAMLVPIALIFIVFVLVVAAALIFILRILPAMQTRRVPRAAAIEAPAQAQWAERTAAPPAQPSAPVGGLGHFVPQYTLGNDNYDTSYSLETPRGEFLGECGMGISETIGEGKPDKVTAFDLWLFDKADVRTVTQILMSEYAFNDQTLRTKLSTKGEAVLAEKGKTLQLETQSLSITAQVVELVYAANPNYPPNSHFQKVIVEIIPTIKEGVAR